MDAQEKAKELALKFSTGGWGRENAEICVEEILNDLNESFNVAKDLHPHVMGLISGSIFFWNKVKTELKELK